MESSQDINCSTKRKAHQGQQACSPLTVKQLALKRSLGLISTQNMNFKYWHSLLLGMDQKVQLFMRKQRRRVRNRNLSIFIKFRSLFQTVNFSKSRLLATFNCKMVIQKFDRLFSPSPRLQTLCSTTVYDTWQVVSQMMRYNTFIRQLYQVRLIPSLKDCKNGQERENEETVMSGSRTIHRKVSETE